MCWRTYLLQVCSCLVGIDVDDVDDDDSDDDYD